MGRKVTVDETMLASAVRYALGRATYIVGVTCDEVRAAWPYLSGVMREVIARDIDEALGMASRLGSTVGMAMDHAEWERLAAWITEQGR